MRRIVLAVLLLIATHLSAALSLRERNARIQLLPAAAQEFLSDVTPIITDVELDSFLELVSDAQREVFIREFWRRRDVQQGTTNNAFRDLYYERLELVKPDLEPVSSDRARTLLLHGEPQERIPIRCESQFRPIEIWKYGYIPSLGRDVRFVFFRPRHRDDFVMWLPPTHRSSDLVADGTSAEVGSMGGVGNPGQCMHGEELTAAVAAVLQNIQRLQTALVPPEIVKAEADVNKLLDSFVLSKPDPKAASKVTRTLSRRERKDRTAALTEAHRKFLDEVAPIINDAERDVFLLMDSEQQRDRFIDEFWKGRDKVNGLTNGAFKDAYYARLEKALAQFERLTADRSRILLLHGDPMQVLKIDCEKVLQPMEIWSYAYLPNLGQELRFVFYEPRETPGQMKLWQPVGRGDADIVELASRELVAAFSITQSRDIASAIRSALVLYKCPYPEEIQIALHRNQNNYSQMMTAFLPPVMDEEAVKTMLRSVVLANPNAPKLTADYSVRYPARQGLRTDASITLLIPRAQLTKKDVGGVATYSIDVTGEVLRNEELYENYRYRFDFPGDMKDETLPIVIDRFLRPGDYRSRIKVVDSNSGAEVIVEHALNVPQLVDTPQQRKAQDLAAAMIGDLKETIESGETRLRIVPLPEELLRGVQKIETLATGANIAAVEFYLDGKKVAIKRQPPYSLDLDFGQVPQVRRIRVVALDADGIPVAGDDVVVNTGNDPFRVRIDSPRMGNVIGKTRVEMSVRVPDGKAVGQVDLYFNETKMATLYSPPYVQMITIPAAQKIGYLRAVATLKDDAISVEDVVMINSPAQMEEIDVHLVELPITVLVRGKPVNDLNEKAFKVLDEGKPVRVSKFEYVKNLPLSIGLAIDTSASMLSRMSEAQRTAGQFFENVMRPGDKAFVVGFDSQPQLVQKWSPHVSDLQRGLSKLRAEEYTALYDAVVYSLYNFLGVKGQRALVILSDGKDTGSKFTFEQAVEYARRSAVPIYVIGLGIRSTAVDVRFKLGKFATETGGNTYYIDRAEDLGRIYTDIQNELRSQYLLSFYPPEGVKSGGKWREVTVQVSEGKVKTIRGYYP